jgi:hypothetical protein
MASKHNLRQKDVSDAMKENMTHLLNRVVTFYQVELKKKLNRSASPPVSSPGNPPHKRTGTLGRSFVTTAATRVGPIYRLSLGTNVPYATGLNMAQISRRSAVFCSVRRSSFHISQPSTRRQAPENQG